MSYSQFSKSYPSIASEPLSDVLRLIRTLNVGPVTFFQLMQRFTTARAALEALPELSLRGGKRIPLAPYSREEANKEIEVTQRYGAKMILYGAPDYPRLLQTINDPPPLITVVGHTHLWQQKDSVAMVGARNASANNCSFAERMGRELGEAGLTVVSGLARGIDTFAHRGSLNTGTIAVIAGGIDNVYPPENSGLYNQIRERGAIISEHPFGALPYSGSFPGRNRIIAAMSLATVVVEASPKSGSLITARFASENGREVFAIPGSPLDPRARGCNLLIRQGATMVENAGDILRELSALRGIPLGETPVAVYGTPQTEPDYAELSAQRGKIQGKLGVSPVSVDELVEQCETSASVVLTVLLELELAGKLRRVSGNKVALTADLEQEEVA